jgi:hypothetical protein
MVLTRAKSKATLQERPQPPFRILDLPAELLGNMCDHLPDADLINVRRTCRVLNAQSSNAFGQRFFSHLIAILHPTSLTTLFEICRHPVLSKYVHQVTVSGERFGHTIPLLGNGETHKDLQSSLEQSGMDMLILTEAFRELSNLRAVRIDVISFYRIEPEEEDRGINCGRKQMFKKDIQDYDKHNRDRHGDDGANRVYYLVLQALERAKVHDKIELRFEFWNTSYDGGEDITFLDLDSKPWKDHVSKLTRYVGVLGQVDFNWVQRLLSSATDLRQFEIRGDDHLLKLSHGPTGIFHWPGFRHIHIEDLFVHHDEWTAFLRLHAPTLEVVSLACMGFPHGRWIEPLATIETMSCLKRVWLFRLLEQAPFPHSSTILRRTSPDYVGILQLDGYEQVKVALSAMRSRPRTVFTDSGTEGVGGERYPYAVDFEIGNAAVDRFVLEDEDDEDDIEEEDDNEDDEEEDEDNDEDA